MFKSIKCQQAVLLTFDWFASKWSVNSGIGIECSYLNLSDKTNKQTPFFLFLSVSMNTTNIFVWIKLKVSIEEEEGYRFSKHCFSDKVASSGETAISISYCIFYSFCFPAKTNVSFTSVFSFLVLHLFTLLPKWLGHSFWTKKGSIPSH